MRRTALATTMAALALAGGASACGSDDEGSGDDAPPAQATATTPTTAPTATTGAPTRADYVAQADAICKRANEESKDINTRLQRRKPTDFAEISALLGESLEAYEATLPRIKALEPPAAARPQVLRWLSIGDEVVATVRELKAAYDAKDEAAIGPASTKLTQLAAARKRIANAIGFRECSQGA